MIRTAEDDFRLLFGNRFQHCRTTEEAKAERVKKTPKSAKSLQ
jgi:hypothetical protein